MSQIKIWRIVAVIQKKPIIKSGDDVDNIKGVIRNCVVRELCSSAGISYPMAWWKKGDYKAKIVFVDQFIGQARECDHDDPVTEEEILDVESKLPAPGIIKRIFYPKKIIDEKRSSLRMRADQIDEEGRWHSPHGSIPLIGTSMPVPEESQNDGPSEQEVWMIAPASFSFDECPDCGQTLPSKTILLVMETTALLPAQCCDNMIWIDQNSHESLEEWV